MPHCDQALRTISRAIGAYRKSTGRSPSELSELVEAKLLNPWLLVCPASHLTVGQCSYVYRGDDLGSDSPDATVIAYDKKPWHKKRRNILFANGRVERQLDDKFEQIIQKDNQLRAELNLPSKPLGS